jgi:hypothetical protein
VHMLIIILLILFINEHLCVGCDNAFNYFSEEGDYAAEDGRYSEADYYYNIALAYQNHTNAPIINPIYIEEYRKGSNIECYKDEDQFGEQYYLRYEGENNSSYLVNAFPICPKAYDAEISFDVTNPNEFDMKINNINLVISQYQPTNTVLVKCCYFGPSAEGIIREYICSIKPMTGIYECKQLSNEYDYIKLPPCEMESFSIYTDFLSPGVYKIGVDLNYTVANDRNNFSTIGIIKEIEIGFFEKENAFYLRNETY